jgi:hypothetical protein
MTTLRSVGGWGEVDLDRRAITTEDDIVDLSELERSHDQPNQPAPATHNGAAGHDEAGEGRPPAAASSPNHSPPETPPATGAPAHESDEEFDRWVAHHAPRLGRGASASTPDTPRLVPDHREPLSTTERHRLAAAEAARPDRVAADDSAAAEETEHRNPFPAADVAGQRAQPSSRRLIGALIARVSGAEAARERWRRAARGLVVVGAAALPARGKPRPGRRTSLVAASAVVIVLAAGAVAALAGGVLAGRPVSRAGAVASRAGRSIAWSSDLTRKTALYRESGTRWHALPGHASRPLRRRRSGVGQPQRVVVAQAEAATSTPVVAERVAVRGSPSAERPVTSAGSGSSPATAGGKGASSGGEIVKNGPPPCFPGQLGCQGG